MKQVQADRCVLYKHKKGILIKMVMFQAADSFPVEPLYFPNVVQKKVKAFASMRK